MTTRVAFLFFGLLSLMANHAWAAAIPAGAAEDPAAERRPRIALVLGGGGAKGAAHIGVLRVLDELRIPIDCVTGTSMGALVGATFAAGVPPAEIEEKVVGIDWSATVGASRSRALVPIRQKIRGITYTNNLEFGIRDGQLTTPAGLLSTQQVEDLLRDLVARARRTNNFDNLPLPFRAVAVDMVAGKMVVLDSGDLALAMRASMAVPGAFAPVVIGDQILSDGGQLRNLPVDVGRDLCGEVVIAVTLDSPPATADQLRGAISVMSRSIDVMIAANSDAQLATLTDRDVSIRVPLGDITSTQFERAAEAIPLGREAAEAQADSLKRYAVSDSEYAAWRARVTRQSKFEFRPTEVTITGLQRVNPAYVRDQLKSTKPGTTITLADLAEDTNRIFALGDFEKIDYQLEGNIDTPSVEIIATEKSYGPNFLHFDLGLEASGGGDVAAVLLANHTRTWINSYGAEWHNSLQVGSSSLVKTGFYQPLEIKQRYFVEPWLYAGRLIEDVYDDGSRLGEYDLDEGFAEIDFGANISNRAQLRAGLQLGTARAKVKSGSPDLPRIDWSQETNIVVEATYDTRNAPAFATEGMLLLSRYINSTSALGGEQSYQLVEGLVIKPLPFRGDTLYFLAAAGQELDGQLPAYRLFRMGGMRSFPGLERHQLRGSGYWLGGLAYNWKLADISPLFGKALYAGFRLTGGEMADRIDEVSEGSIYSAALSLNGRTPIGPLIISLGATDNGFWQLQLGLGRPVDENSIWDEAL